MARKKKTTRRSKTGTRKRAASSRSSSVTAKRRTRRTSKTAKRTQPRRSAATASPGAMSLAELQAEISSRVSKLHERRSELEAELAEIDSALAEAGAAAAAPASPAPQGRRRGRPPGSGRKAASGTTKRAPRTTQSSDGRTKGKGGKNLAESLYDVLKGKEMKVSELVDAVQAAGYNSKSPNFRVMVSAALSRNKDTMFKNVRRGVYTTI